MINYVTFPASKEDHGNKIQYTWMYCKFHTLRYFCHAIVQQVSLTIITPPNIGYKGHFM